MPLKYLPALLVGGFGALFALAGPETPPESGYNPPVAKASDEAEKAIGKFKYDKSLKVEVWAAEPLLANPVAFTFDNSGRCFVAETFRLHHGVEDTRGHMNWLDDDLACKTVADRVAMYKKFAKDNFHKQYELEHERVRLLDDPGKTGKATRSSVFADDFGHAKDGIGAGLLVHDDDVYYTCIPDLWLLKDTKNTGKADVKKSLATGFGIHVQFLGHDLHALRIGPDGKLYFTIGDRGLNVVNKEGKKLFNPNSGALLRCDLDGANLEVVATGLRNPQDLAFDDHGNLFTVDNNCDAGDKARLVYLVEGGDSGWRNGFQFDTAWGRRGPWHQEKLWHLKFDGQPAYILPPLAHYADGPSGLCYYPGTGLGDRYQGHFFLCDFKGSAGGSGVGSFAVKPKGAAFEMTDAHRFLWSILATDCDFGPDSAFYVSDWIEGWEQTGKGRIYKVTDPRESEKQAVVEAKKLLAGGIAKRETHELVDLLAHPNQRVRQEAQFALVDRPAKIELISAAKSAMNPLARLHAIWGLGMLRPASPEAAETLAILLQDKDTEVATQAAKTLGSLLPALKAEWPGEVVNSLLRIVEKHTEPRLRFQAAMTLSKLTGKLDGIIRTRCADVARRLLRQNADDDAYLRHAAVMLLASIPDLSTQSQEGLSPAERLGMVLAFRRQAAAGLDVAHQLIPALSDPDVKVVAEAARAIHELNIPAALPNLAALTAQVAIPPDAVLIRALDANFTLGKPENAKALAMFAARSDASAKWRSLAVKMLGEWAKPPRRDYVHGLTQDLGTRDEGVAAAAFRDRAGGIFSGPAGVQKEAAATAGKLGIRDVGPFLVAMVSDGKAQPVARIEALHALDVLKDEQLQEAVQSAISSEDPRLRNAGRAILGKTEPGKVLKQIVSVLSGTNLVEKQGALALLGQIKGAEAETILEEWMKKLLAGQVPAELQLDILEATAHITSKPIVQMRKKYTESLPKDDALAPWRETMQGGDADRGRQIFLSNAAVYCQRCHKVDGQGGEVGPSLNGIGTRQKRDYLLESIVLPNKQIAKGYEGVRILTLDGKVISGVLRSENAQIVNVMTPEGQLVTVKKEDIDSRKADKSAMPEDLVQKLSKPELRDLVEFLASLKEEAKK